MNTWPIRISFILTLIFVTSVTYWPGLRGPYVLDDHENIASNEALAIHEITLENLYRAMMSGDSGPFKRPLASLSFALNHYFANGFDRPFLFKTTNLAIHIINGILIFFLTLRLTQAPALRDKLTRHEATIFSGIAAGLWTLHPIQLTNVLYVVQRMSSLSALFVLAGLLLFTHGRILFDTTKLKGLLLMTGGTLSGMMFGMATKENAALLPLFALTLEYTLFRFHVSDQSKQKLLVGFYVLLVALPVMAFSVYLANHPGFISDSYVTRNFSIFERVLTESRILWFYVGLIVLPTNHRLGLFHDDIELSMNLLTPISTLFAIAGIVIALVLAFSQNQKRPVIGLAILWFLAGHVLESSIFGLELAYEHRNYLPSYGILLALAYAVVMFIKNRSTIYYLIPSVIFLTLGFSTWSLAHTWSNVRTLAEHTVTTHPNSARANIFAARVSLDITAAIQYTLNGLRIAPNEVGFHIDLLLLLNSLSSEVERNLTTLPTRSGGQSFTLQLPDLDTPLEATMTKHGLRLAHRESGPDTILTLLKTMPITVHGIVSLENLHHCLLETTQPCAPIQDSALSWFTAAAENTRTAPDYQAILSNNAATMYARRGDTVRAFELANHATTLLPNHIPYQLATTEYLIRLERMEDAARAIEKIITALALEGTALAKYEPEVRRLKQLYAEAADKKSRRLFRPK